MAFAVRHVNCGLLRDAKQGAQDKREDTGTNREHCVRKAATSARKVGEMIQPGLFVVDDDAGIRDTLRLLLEDAGYQVNEASDGATALGMLREMEAPHVVLLDQHLPGLSGDVLLRTVASDAALRLRHAYVLLTANSSDQACRITQSIPHMDVAVVTKPFDVDDLLDTITAVTGRLSGTAGEYADGQPPVCL